jgi:hypothetical protein
VLQFYSGNNNTSCMKQQLLMEVLPFLPALHATAAGQASNLSIPVLQFRLDYQNRRVSVIQAAALCACYNIQQG